MRRQTQQGYPKASGARVDPPVKTSKVAKGVIGNAADVHTERQPCPSWKQDAPLLQQAQLAPPTRPPPRCSPPDRRPPAQLRLTLKQHRYEPPGSSHMQSFSDKCGAVPRMCFLCLMTCSVAFSLVCLIRKQIIHVTQNMCSSTACDP